MYDNELLRRREKFEKARKHFSPEQKKTKMKQSSIYKVSSCIVFFIISFIISVILSFILSIIMSFIFNISVMLSIIISAIIIPVIILFFLNELYIARFSRVFPEIETIFLLAFSLVFIPSSYYNILYL